LRAISDFYQTRVNKGAALERGFVWGLSDYVRLFLSEHPEYLDRPASEMLAVALSDVPGLIEAQKAIWGKALAAAKAYYSEMSPELAKAFFEALPDKQLPRLAFDQKVLVSHVAFADVNMAKLEEEFEEGEPNAVDVGFRLIYISDGAASEWLFHALGEIIPKRPGLFLEKAAAHLDRLSPDDSDLILEGLVLDLVGWWEVPEDDDEAGMKWRALIEKERALRIKALLSVDEEGLQAIRGRWLAMLGAGNRPE